MPPGRVWSMTVPPAPEHQFLDFRGLPGDSGKLVGSNSMLLKSRWDFLSVLFLTLILRLVNQTTYNREVCYVESVQSQGLEKEHWYVRENSTNSCNVAWYHCSIISHCWKEDKLLFSLKNHSSLFSSREQLWENHKQNSACLLILLRTYPFGSGQHVLLYSVGFSLLGNLNI